MSTIDKQTAEKIMEGGYSRFSGASDVQRNGQSEARSDLQKP
jgi:hypothetical protein